MEKHNQKKEFYLVVFQYFHVVGRSEGRSISNLILTDRESDQQRRMKRLRERERAERDYYHEIEITFAKSAYPVPTPMVKKT